jgi:hypothetical protein
VRLLPVRVVWLALPLVAGTAASHAVEGWADAPRVVAIAFLWLGWGIGLVALLAPRPVGLTAVRTIAPAFAVLALVGAIWGDASTVAAGTALIGAVVAAALVADPAVALASANGVAYGDERRNPLRAPPALYLAPIPIARAVAVAGLVAAPLLLADERLVWGVVALIGLPLAWLAIRALHTLARRWLVTVPAGVVVVDPMTLVDPVLIVRRNLRGVRAVDAAAAPAPGAVDLRLGATLGTVEVALDGSIDVVRGGRRHRADTIRPEALLLAVAGRRELLARGSRRSGPERPRGEASRSGRGDQAAMPPPSSESPS